MHNIVVTEVYMPLEETFFGTRSAMLPDRFGVAWTVISHKPMPDL